MRTGQEGKGETEAHALRGYRRQIQPVEAFNSTSSVNNSEGFFQLCILRGRSLISQATIAKYLGSELISTPLGKYSRTMRLRFSLLPRSHGECGWAKYTGSPVAVMSVWRAISEPQSQVSDRRICAGSPPVAAMTASPTVSESRPVNGTRMRNREVRSTNVATAVLPSLPITSRVAPAHCCAGAP